MTRVVGPGRTGHPRVGELAVALDREHVGERALARTIQRIPVHASSSYASGSAMQIARHRAEDRRRHIGILRHRRSVGADADTACQHRSATMGAMPPPVIVRPATPSDVAGIAAVWYPGWRDAHPATSPTRSWPLVANRRSSPRAEARVAATTVAVIDDEVAGFVTVIDDEVEQVYVAAGHRGHGVADALMDAAEQQLRAAGSAGPGWPSSPATSALGVSTSDTDGGTRGPSTTTRRTATPTCRSLRTAM